jgi:hypothetical protein
MILETTKGNRRDVVVAAKAQGRLNPPTEYIGNILFPIDLKAEKTGTIYHSTLTADVAAQTSRAQGVAPTATYLATSASTYACAEHEKRYGVTRDEVKSFGSIENADMFGVSAAVRSCWRAYEAKVATTLIDSTGYSARYACPSGKVLEGLRKAAQSVKRYPGKLALVCSEDWYLDFLGQTDVKTAIQATFGNSSLSVLEAMLSQAPSATVKLMLAVIRFDAILIGDNAHWKLDAYPDAAAVVKVPSLEPMNRLDLTMAYKSQPILGISHFWLPDPADAELVFEASSFYDDDVKANKYDASAWFDVDQLNAGAKQLVTVPSPVFASTTTTTTTTTT